MTTAALQLQNFDSEVFGVPFYRLKILDKSHFLEDLSLIARERQFMADAKIESSNLDWSLLLANAGFRKVCTQVEFKISDYQVKESDDTANVEDIIAWSDEKILRHALHFEYDRFSLDPLIERKNITELYFRWIKNSLTSPSVKIVLIKDNFCSFKITNETVRIDLMSVLDKRQGIGKRLLTAILGWAQENGNKPVFVTTECENTPAWKLYASQGFRVNQYYSCFHFVKR